MDRFRFGLAGMGGPLTERRLYPDGGDRLTEYARRFQALEAPFSAQQGFTADHAQAIIDRLPYHVRIAPRVDVEVMRPGRIGPWVDRIRPWLQRRGRAPLYLPWHGVRTDAAEQRLGETLSDLWHHLPGDERIAIEFHDPSWFRSSTIHLLEENGTGLVWSTVAGKVPYRLTADFIYVRLTGVQRRVADEVDALAGRVTSRPEDRRPVYVISTRHTEPYGLHALERFAAKVGAKWRMDEVQPDQARLDGFAVVTR